MIDLHEIRLWNEHHTDFGNAVHSVLRAIHASFDPLVARLYDAPWERTSRNVNGK